MPFLNISRFQVPETEGKAGMAAIVDPEHKLDIENLAAGIKGSLPPYARPVFIRIMAALPMTGTFKLKKRDLQLEGYNITKITDPIYLRWIVQEINSGKTRRHKRWTCEAVIELPVSLNILIGC